MKYDDYNEQENRRTARRTDRREYSDNDFFQENRASQAAPRARTVRAYDNERSGPNAGTQTTRRRSDGNFDRNEGYSSRRHSKDSGHKKRWSALSLVLIDFSIFAAALLVFALFHHVLPGKPEQGIALPSPSVSSTTSVSLSQSASAGSSQSTSTASSATTSDNQAQVQDGLFGAKFAQHFATGDPVVTDDSYQGKNCSVKITKVQQNNVTYYVSDVYVRDPKYFRTTFATDTFQKGTSAWTLDMAKKVNAVSAMSGTYCGIRNEGTVVSNGVLYRDATWEDTLVMFTDGTMETYSPSEFNLQTLSSRGIWQVWSFGPMLLTNGEAMEKFNSNLNPRNPRAAIGYFEPGHYCFVLVDGRQEGYSVGLTLQDLSKLMKELGCTVAYNLDGGQSATLVYQDNIVSKPYSGGRKTSDIVFVADTLS